MSIIAVNILVYVFTTDGFSIREDVVRNYAFALGHTPFLNFISSGMSGGVANFAHIGGVFAGALICLIMGMKRDSAELSEAKALQSETGDLSMVTFPALQSMLDYNPVNPEVIRAMITPALRFGYSRDLERAFARAGPSLVDKDPSLVGYYLTALNGNIRSYNATQVLKAACGLDRDDKSELAIQLYQLLLENFKTAPECEIAMYRLAEGYWRVYKDK